MKNSPNNSTTRLGAHIPLIYHFAMLQDSARMLGFKEAILAAVKPGARVLELGGGTGVLSFFAAEHASKVYCVEQIPANAAAARQFLAANSNGDKVEVICADAFEYLPPEPIDVVICEMIHVGMVRERQIEMIESFKSRYRKHFGEKQPLPRFVPEALIQAVQPLSYNFNFFGYHAAVPLFQVPGSIPDSCRELAQPLIYQMAQYKDTLPLKINWQGVVSIKEPGSLNALRLILKNLLAIIPEQNRSIDWNNHYLVLPLKQALEVQAGDSFRIELVYETGCEIEELMQSINVSKVSAHKSLSSQIEVIREPASDIQHTQQLEARPKNA